MQNTECNKDIVLNIVPDHLPSLRKLAAHNLKLQTDRMVTRGNDIIPSLKVGDNVLVLIPSVDR